VQIEYPDPQIVCDDCGQAEAESEALAEANGWLVGDDGEHQTHTHICPTCRGATV
jgi:Zn finger protein HypA/HybF involved in hydrogenase expression